MIGSSCMPIPPRFMILGQASGASLAEARGRGRVKVGTSGFREHDDGQERHAVSAKRTKSHGPAERIGRRKYPDSRRHDGSEPTAAAKAKSLAAGSDVGRKQLGEGR